MAWESRIIGHGEAAPADLVGNPRNWRTHPQAQRDALAGVLDEVGWVQDVIVNKRTGYLVDGHARVAVAAQRGEASVPVVYVDLSEDEERLILATLDPLSAMAEADDDALADLLAAVTAEDGALSSMLEALAPLAPVDGSDTEAGEPAEEPYVKLGEVWTVGEHRIMCGDSTNGADVARLLGGEKPLLMMTSPPYLQQRTYDGAGFDWDELMNGVTGAWLGNLSPDSSVIVNLGLVHRDGRVIRYWDGWIRSTEASGWPLYGWYVWDQGWGLPGDWSGRLAPSMEFVFHFAAHPRHTNKTVETTGEGKIRNSTFRQADGSLRPFTGNGQATGSDKVADSVIRINRQVGPVSIGVDHPAVFSVGFPEHLIPIWTEQGEAVCDPFLGSGTTAIAAANRGRKCYGMEISPAYAQVSIERLAAHIGEIPERAK